MSNLTIKLSMPRDDLTPKDHLQQASYHPRYQYTQSATFCLQTSIRPQIQTFDLIRQSVHHSRRTLLGQQIYQVLFPAYGPARNIKNITIVIENGLRAQSPPRCLS